MIKTALGVDESGRECSRQLVNQTCPVITKVHVILNEVTQTGRHLSRCIVVLATAASILSSFINLQALNFQNLTRQSDPEVTVN